MTPDEEQRQQEKEYESVSEQSDQILLYMQDRFQELMEENQTENAIAIGDEFLEWIGQYPDEVFLYYNENELKQDYESKR
jgi:tRNA splicing ligase